MLDLNQLIDKQNEGNRLLSALNEDEETIIQNYCALAAQGLINMGSQQKEPVQNVVLNAFRNGICLGLGIRVDRGAIQERS